MNRGAWPARLGLKLGAFHHEDFGSSWACGVLCVGRNGTPASANHSMGRLPLGGKRRQRNAQGQHGDHFAMEHIRANAIQTGMLERAYAERRAPLPGANTKKCSPIAGQILVCNASLRHRGWLGIASIWLTSGHISQATTKLTTAISIASIQTPAWRASGCLSGDRPRLRARPPGRGLRQLQSRYLHGLHQRS